jgi:hypothetical protein
MGQCLDDEADAHDVAQAHPPGDPAVQRRAQQAADRGDGGEQAEVDRPDAEPPLGMEHEDRPGRAERDVKD